MLLALPWKLLPLVQFTEIVGAFLGPFPPWVPLKCAEDQGYPATNLLLNNKLGFLLWVISVVVGKGNISQLRKPLIIFIILPFFFLNMLDGQA